MQPVSFWQSPLFAAILSSAVTLVVGFVAYLVYLKQRNDRKKDAASTVLLEIKNAQTHLRLAKDSLVKEGLIKEDVFLLPTAQWERHKYLFSRDLTSEDMIEINLFYENCKLYDEIVRYNNTFFVKNEEQIRTNLQAALADYTKSYLSELSVATTQGQADNARDQYKNAIEAFAREFMEEVNSSTSDYFYRPRKTFDDANALMQIVNMNITSSQGYAKLQKIAGQG